jgi:hypothetical protein
MTEPKKQQHFNRDFFVNAGKRGGTATMNIHGVEHFKTISKKANDKRWSKKAK